MFKLDDRLKSDTIFVKELKSFQIRLMDANEFFWIILVPKKNNLTELSDLKINERNCVMNFAVDLGKFIKNYEKYDKETLDIFSHKVLEKIIEGSTEWEKMVPPIVARLIKENNLFNFRRRKFTKSKMSFR